MKKYLDDMQVFFEGSGEFDPTYFASLETCMGKFNDTETHHSQDAAWEGMGDYWRSNGTSKDYMNETDYWGGCIPEEPNTRCPVGDYEEWLANKAGGKFGSDDMQVFEPCNYASNVAYYHSASRICDYPDFSVDVPTQGAFKKSFTTLAMGSAFWHGSHTYDGYSFDNNMIAVISYVAHQASVSFLPASSVLTDLSTTPRGKTGIQVSDDLVTMFYEKPVTEWAEVLDTCDISHDYYITFAAIFSTVASLLLPFFAVELVINKLCGFLLPASDAAFIKNEYLVALKPAVANIKISGADKMDLLKKVGGVLIKIAYAFVW